MLQIMPSNILSRIHANLFHNIYLLSLSGRNDTLMVCSHVERFLNEHEHVMNRRLMKHN